MDIPILKHKYINTYDTNEEYESDKVNYEEVNYSLIKSELATDENFSEYQYSIRTTNNDNLKKGKYWSFENINIYAGLDIIWGYFGWQYTDYEYEGEILKGGNFTITKPMTVVKNIPDGNKLQHINNFLRYADNNSINKIEYFNNSNIKAGSYIFDKLNQDCIIDKKIILNWSNLNVLTGPFIEIGWNIIGNNLENGDIIDFSSLKEGIEYVQYRNGVTNFEYIDYTNSAIFNKIIKIKFGNIISGVYEDHYSHNTIELLKQNGENQFTFSEYVINLTNAIIYHFLPYYNNFVYNLDNECNNSTNIKFDNNANEIINSPVTINISNNNPICNFNFYGVKDLTNENIIYNIIFNNPFTNYENIKLFYIDFNRFNVDLDINNFNNIYLNNCIYYKELNIDNIIFKSMYSTFKENCIINNISEYINVSYNTFEKNIELNNINNIGFENNVINELIANNTPLSIRTITANKITTNSRLSIQNENNIKEVIINNDNSDNSFTIYGDIINFNGVLGDSMHFINSNNISLNLNKINRSSILEILDSDCFINITNIQNMLLFILTIKNSIINNDISFYVTDDVNNNSSFKFYDSEFKNIINLYFNNLKASVTINNIIYNGENFLINNVNDNYFKNINYTIDDEEKITLFKDNIFNEIKAATININSIISLNNNFIGQFCNITLNENTDINIKLLKIDKSNNVLANIIINKAINCNIDLDIFNATTYNINIKEALLLENLIITNNLIEKQTIPITLNIDCTGAKLLNKDVLYKSIYTDLIDKIVTTNSFITIEEDIYNKISSDEISNITKLFTINVIYNQ